LRGVEHTERGAAFDRRLLPALHILVVAACLEILVAEILYRLVVEQAVDGASIGLESSSLCGLEVRAPLVMVTVRVM
jgi:hypothetical protein